MQLLSIRFYSGLKFHQILPDMTESGMDRTGHISVRKQNDESCLEPIRFLQDTMMHIIKKHSKSEQKLFKIIKTHFKVSMSLLRRRIRQLRYLLEQAAIIPSLAKWQTY